MKHLGLIALALATGCASSDPPDPGLEQLALDEVAPDVIVPGTLLHVRGASFVEDAWGATSLHLVGSADGTAIDQRWSAKFVDFNTLSVAIDGGKLDAIGGTVDFDGTVTVEVVATSDGNTYASEALDTTLHFKETLTPTVTGIVDGVHFVNDQIAVDGDGFLLGGDEGATIARVTGCFQPDAGGACEDLAAPVDVALVPATPYSRKHATFPFSPRIAGIRPGQFIGAIAIVDHQTGKAETKASPVDGTFTLVTSQIFQVTPTTASLGQYVFVSGGGFVGGEMGADTELELKGQFTKTGGSPVQVTLGLVPEFVEGKLVRYIINVSDQLGMSLDLRKDTGQFTGTITPIVSYGADTVRGQSSPASFAIAPVRQVVQLNFTPSYVEGLRDFGMRGVDSKIRDRILAVCRKTYAGVNMDFRTEPVTDFAEFANVDLVGVDPNDMGLFGYDNTPGKDSGNQRLYDGLGGVNALTQEDGFPGYGGVFVRSLMGFSKHPGSFAQSIEGADPTFDQLFDPFRADVGGSPITSGDLTGGVDVLADGSGCPAGGDRKQQIACAVFVLGNLIGGTLSHEIGHSLGLAYPFGEGFHDAGDQANRLMDSGGDRPFTERAELAGQGPGVFCDEEFTYLQDILPSSDPAPDVQRPTCY